MGELVAAGMDGVGQDGGVGRRMSGRLDGGWGRRGTGDVGGKSMGEDEGVGGWVNGGYSSPRKSLESHVGQAPRGEQPAPLLSVVLLLLPTVPRAPLPAPGRTECALQKSKK